MAAISRIPGIQIPPPTPMKKRKSSALCPQSPLSPALLSKLQKQQVHPFTKKIKLINDTASQNGWTPIGEGICMKAWLNTKTQRVIKCFSLDLVSEGSVISAEEQMRCLKAEIQRIEKIKKVAKITQVFNNPIDDGFYEQTYLPFPLPNDLSEDMIDDLVRIITDCYQNGYLVDINPGNFRCLEENGPIHLCDFGIGFTAEHNELDESHDIEIYRETIAASFAGWLNGWDKMYPGARSIIAERFKVDYPALYATLTPRFQHPLLIPNEEAPFNPLLPDPALFA